MNLYEVLKIKYYFDNSKGILYRKTKKGLTKLNPSGNSKQVTITGKKYKLAEVVYLLKNPDYILGSKRILAVDYQYPTFETVIPKDQITVSNYKDYYYYCAETGDFYCKFSFKGNKIVGNKVAETRNSAGTLSVVLDRDYEIQKAALVWHWYTGEVLQEISSRFIYIDRNKDNTNIDNLVLNTENSQKTDYISYIRLNYMFKFTTEGILTPLYKTNMHPAKGYTVLSMFNTTIGIHRILYALYHNEYLKLKSPAFVIDHINHNRDDNSKLNLRKIESYLNSRNRSKNCNNTSGYNGIRKVNNSFRVEIASVYLGSYSTLEEALNVRNTYTAANNYHSNHGLTS